MAELKIDYEAVRENCKFLKQKLGSKKFCAVVKANAYGLGAKKVCEKICDLVDFFAVNNIFEAKQILKFGKPVLILMPTEKFLKSDNCHYVVFSLSNCQKICEFAKKNNMCANVHLKINSGMNRLGADLNEAQKICEFAKNNLSIKVVGVCTHNMESTGKLHINQNKKFNDILCKLNLGPEVIVHSESSFSVLNNQTIFGDMARCGIAIYGGEIGTKSVVNFFGKVITIREIEKGERVSYGGEFKAKKNTKIAVVDIGYHNGVPRKFAKNGYLFFKNKPLKIIGRICMNMLILNVKNENLKIGDRVEFIGKNQNIILLAKKLKTISYEVLTNLKI